MRIMGLSFFIYIACIDFVEGLMSFEGRDAMVTVSFGGALQGPSISSMSLDDRR